MQTEIIMKRPTSWHNDMWREGAPFGNGLLGGMVYGGITFETVLINHAYLWKDGENLPLPDVSDKLSEVRRLLDEHKNEEADKVIPEALTERGYKPGATQPNCFCDLLLNCPQKDSFTHYRRKIHMDKAEVEVTWNVGEAKFKRTCFLSRANNMLFYRYTVENGTIDANIALMHHNYRQNTGDTNVEAFRDGTYNYFAAENISAFYAGDFGAVSNVVTDGEIVPADKVRSNNDIPQNVYIGVQNATYIDIAVDFFIATPRKEGWEKAKERVSKKYNYDEELQKHVALYSKYWNTVDFSLGTESNTANEDLLAEAYEEDPPLELMEKLYSYGRYLFLCATSDKDTLPCHLTGLYNGGIRCFWAFYMFNVNFELIYWQALSGNLPSFLRLALDYTESFMDDFRESAKKLFGCRGIWIDSVNTPESGLPKCLAHHIVNWTGGAPWFAQHFWDYYRYTEDIDYLKEHALPFMYETALFYEDFAVENADGYYDLYPSVSPENSPSNVLNKYHREIETTKNATMEFALMKELLTNLLEGCKITGMYPEKQETWKKMLSKIRPYKVNEDGAVSEWIDDFCKDRYDHRHHSHIYPVFPGHEITKDHPLYPAFRKAEDLRLQYGLSSQSSWSMIFMAGIATAMERGDFAFHVLETMARNCLMNNLFTVHNDWRGMGPVACDNMQIAPFQIDGNIGVPAIFDNMLLQSQNDNVNLFPALPSKWEKGHSNGLLARGNIICNIEWNGDNAKVHLHADKPKTKEIVLGSGFAFEDGTTSKTTEISDCEFVLHKVL